jgi:hypothetical protein
MMSRWTLTVRFPVLVVVLTGCTVYHSHLTLRPEPPEGGTTETMVTLEDERIAGEIVSALAEKYEMSLVPGPYDDKFTEPYRGLPFFKGRGFHRDVALGAMVHKNGSEIVFTVTDQAHGNETELTSAIERNLDEAVARQFPGFLRTWDRSSVARNPLAP